MTLEQIILYPLRGQRVSYEALATQAELLSVAIRAASPAEPKAKRAPRKVRA